jgi:hypothetical protein
LESGSRTEQTIPAVHVNWTGPHRQGWRRQGLGFREETERPYELPPEELVTTVHSILAWRAHHGPIHLITDDLGAAYAAEQNLAALYDLVDTSLDELDRLDIEPLLYPTAGKMYAATLRPAPFAVIDTDLYIRRPLDLGGGHGFGFAHWETVDNTVYPDPRSLPAPEGTDVHTWKFDTLAANMAITLFFDDRHRQEYARAALEFMTGNSAPYDGLFMARALFAEQRVAPAVARAMGLELRPVTDRLWKVDEGLWDGPSYAALFHHTWHQKHVLRQFPELRPAYLRYLLEDLLWRHPESGEILLAVPALTPHHPLIRSTREDLRAHGPTTQWSAPDPGSVPPPLPGNDSPRPVSA